MTATAGTTSTPLSLFHFFTSRLRERVEISKGSSRNGECVGTCSCFIGVKALAFPNFRTFRCFRLFSKLRVGVDDVPDVGLLPFVVGYVGELVSRMRYV